MPRLRFKDATGRSQSEAGGGRGRSVAWCELAIAPRFPARQVCEHSRLLSLLKDKVIDWRKVGFPRRPHEIISQHESAIALNPGSGRSFLEANTWGLLFYATEIEEQKEKYSGIHFNKFLGHVLLFTRHASVLMRQFGYEGPLHVEMALNDIGGVPWVSFEDNLPQLGKKSELDDKVVFIIDAKAQDLACEPDRLAIDLLRYVLFATNWPEAADTPDKLQGLVQEGYKFNFWEWPN